MIKFINTAIILVLTSSCSYAQSYSEDNKMLAFGKNIYEIISIYTDDQNGYEAFIKIFKTKNEEKILINSIEIPDTKYNTDMISFGELINKEKKFVLVLDRYSFYILNLYNNKLLGPYSPKFYGIGQDAQSGMITDLNIIYNGRFLTGYCVDSGPFLFDLTYLYQAKEEIPVTFPLFSENRVYILNQLDHKDKQFALFLSNDNWICKHKFLFKGKIIEDIEHPQINYSEDIEELFSESEFPNADQFYTILKEILSENDFQFLVYDNYSGKEIILPDSLKKSNERNIKAYLNSK